MFKNERGGGVKGRLNNVKKKDNLVRWVVPKEENCWGKDKDLDIFHQLYHLVQWQSGVKLYIARTNIQNFESF